MTQPVDEDRERLGDLTPEELAAAMESYVLMINQTLTDVMRAYQPLLQAWLDELGRTLTALHDLVTALHSAQRPPHDRPAWQSPHGPARTKRGK